MGLKSCWFVFPALLGLALGSTALAAHKRTVLITAFEPFGDSKVNWSVTVANRIAFAHQQFGKDVEIKVCVLPVVYDRAAQKAMECYEAMKPKPVAVLSLGEGFCAISLETAEHNLDSTSAPDNAGNVRMNHIIDKRYPESVGMTLPVDDLFCSSHLEPQEVRHTVISASPGGFVCNNTAFHLAAKFNELHVPYGFIHVPSNACAGFGDFSDLNVATSVVGKMLGTALARTRVDVRDRFLPFIHHTVNCLSSRPMAHDLDSVEQLVDATTGSLDQACKADFYRKLENAHLLFMHTVNARDPDRGVN
jgi:pyrrolidone-carboxylate peptidase